jgi:GntR family transcriptional regulator / MocR family aminotransferase
MARGWEFIVNVASDSPQPLFLRIAGAIARDIRRGRLRPGERLPGTRTLAQTIGVNRVTVLAAYDELAAEGWVVLRPARGTFVAPQPPLRGTPRSRAREVGLPAATYPIPAGPSTTTWLRGAPGVLLIHGTYPDTRLVRFAALAREYRRALRHGGAALLAYTEPTGHPRLRAAIAQMVRGTRALPAAPDNILVTRGSQMALTLIATALFRPGDVVAVEALGYRNAWAAFRQAGAALMPIPVDAEGFDVDALERRLSHQRITAVYVTPHHQLPTTVTLSAARRTRLLALARRHRFVVIEDDFDHEFHFEGRPMAALASSDPGPVIYIGTFSKLLAPGLRMGFLVAPRDVVQQLSAHRQLIDIHGDPAFESALATLIDDGELQRHTLRARRIYRNRRDMMVEALHRRLSGALTFATPAGGVGLWADVAPGIDVERWASAAPRHGVAFLTGRAFTIDGAAIPHLRLGFAALNEREIAQAVERLAAALSALEV